MKSLAELDAIRDKVKNRLDLREVKEDRTRIVVGMATCGISAGARDVLVEFVKEIESRGLSGITVTQMGCIGLCSMEPIVEVHSPGMEKVIYANVTPEKADKIIAEHIIGGKPVEEFAIGAAQTGGM